MKVYVVMSNDFPDCVFAKESDAESYCVTKNSEQKSRHAYMVPRIYYRSYDFEVKQ